MKVTRKNLSDGKVQLDVVASPEDVAKVLHQASVAFAQQMSLRPEKDKSIAQIAQEKLGIKDLDSIVESQAIEGLVPFALDKKNIVPAYPPKPKVNSSLKRGREFKFSMTVTPKPEYELETYAPVTISVPPFDIDDSLIDAEIEKMAEQYVDYVADDPHPVKKGDTCKIALDCTQDGKKLEALATEGRTYMVGEGYMPKSFDDGIIGMQPGETKTFTFDGPSIDDDGNEITSPVDCTVSVLEIQKKVRPTIDDEWVQKNMPFFRGYQSLRGAIKDQIASASKQQYNDYVNQMAASEFARGFKGRIDDSIYEAMRENLMDNVRANLQQQGMTFEQFVEQQGGQQQFGMMLMLQAREMLVQGYSLDALYRHEKMTLTDKDIDDACRAINPQQNPKSVRKQMEDTGYGFALRETAERLKANKWLVEHSTINIVDPKEVQ